MKMKQPTTTLHCFSPPVMILTFFIELALAVWTLWRYKHTALVRLVAAILVCLAIFQLAEFTICESWLGLDQLTWARIGYVAITALPALGLHLLTRIAKVNAPWIVRTTYTIMVIFMAYFLLAGHGISATICGGNYVLFETNLRATSWYTLYYYGLEIGAIITAYVLARKTKDKQQRQALYGLTAAYMMLIIPVATANLINPKLVHAIPSIMCGFAVFLALTVALYVLPRTASVRA